MIKASGSNVLVELADGGEQKSAGGIILTRAPSGPERGTVVSIGGGVGGGIYECDSCREGIAGFKVGDTVLFDPGAGLRFEEGSMKLVFLNEESVVGYIESDDGAADKAPESVG